MCLKIETVQLAPFVKPHYVLIMAELLPLIFFIQYRVSQFRQCNFRLCRCLAKQPRDLLGEIQEGGRFQAAVTVDAHVLNLKVLLKNWFHTVSSK